MRDKELQWLVEEVSLKYFDKPFRHQAFFNSRLKTTGGRYMLSDHRIEINRAYLEQLGMDELIGIIKHELCHYHLHIEGKGYQHRDKDFKDLMIKVDAPRFCSALPQQQKRKSNKTIFYQCVNCHQVYRRKRRMDTKKYVCGKCRGKLLLMTPEDAMKG
ncbi:SprT-like protein [Cytobacillus horneckiae]|uniref:Protein SprT-like n=1 Tax=Cytobacillus horneckiae TaxID=549687 RepID=A0A2N0ZJR5_9BACI|nr:SprT family protein [Cytobacillus horneckiae]MBN6888570.1 SprT family protein [Cytobacillus horneckiae]MCM3180475.1 SprT family protein [Cytobacillus horneckiae]MEC1158850.1 SprT family protein [Cytobacillus horneckiae]MED2938729.1 SprT family protein [Cytobacillus horneckiae]PKG29770.1 SprT family protein [Cytobacillus horneckiae]